MKETDEKFEAWSFSILDWIVFSGTQATFESVSTLQEAFQYPRLDRFLWNRCVQIMRQVEV